MTLRYPVEQGIMMNFVDGEQIWKYAYEQLCAASEEHSVLVTEPPFVPDGIHEKQLQVFFETFTVPSYYTVTTAVFSLMAAGKMSGISVEMGGGVSAVMPVYEGYVVPNTSQTSRINGECLMDFSMRLLTERGYSVTTSAEKEIVRACKEEMGTVSMDFYDLLEHPPEEKTFKLPEAELEWTWGWRGTECRSRCSSPRS